MRQVVWTKRVVEFFEVMGNLNKFQRDVLETRVAGMTIKEQAEYLSCSTSTISRCIDELKHIYDVIQTEYPEELEPRKKSSAELYMDQN